MQICVLSDKFCLLRFCGSVLIIPNLSAFQGTEGGVESVQRHSCWQNGLFCADFWLEREMGTCGTHRPFAQAQEQVCLFMRLTTVLNADMQVKHSLYILLEMSLPAVSWIDNVQNTRQCRYAICHCEYVHQKKSEHGQICIFSQHHHRYKSSPSNTVDIQNSKT